MSNFGTEMDIGEGAIGSKLDTVVGEGTEGGDKESRVVIEFHVARDDA